MLIYFENFDTTNLNRIKYYIINFDICYYGTIFKDIFTNKYNEKRGNYYNFINQ